VKEQSRATPGILFRKAVAPKGFHPPQNLREAARERERGDK